MIRDLRGALEVDERTFLMLRAHGLEEPAVIQLLGEVVRWAPLWLPSVTFLRSFGKSFGEKFGGRLGEKAADFVWDCTGPGSLDSFPS